MFAPSAVLIDLIGMAGGFTLASSFGAIKQATGSYAEGHWLLARLPFAGCSGLPYVKERRRDRADLGRALNQQNRIAT